MLTEAQKLITRQALAVKAKSNKDLKLREYALCLLKFLEDDYCYNGRHWVPFDHEQGAQADGPLLTRNKLLKLFETWVNS